MTINDQVADELVPSKPRNLPNRILRAIDNALHLRGLPRNVRATLGDIVRFVPQSNPLESVFAHKKKIAERTGASERTVYRHLKSLETRGLIKIQNQERKSRSGRFSVARICLTKQAIELLGFTQIDVQAPCSALPNSDVIHSQPSDTLSSRHTLTEPTISKNQPAKTKNGLPIDLHWLTGQGVSKYGIFKLMRLAKANNKFLSDVVLVTRSYLEDKRGGALFGYLAKICQGKSDFSYAAKLERNRIEDDKAARILKEKASLFRERFKNTTLTNRAQNKLFVIDGKAKFVQVFTAKGNGSMPLNDFREFIEGIETGRLVLATLATENRLMNRE